MWNSTFSCNVTLKLFLLSRSQLFHVMLNPNCSCYIKLNFFLLCHTQLFWIHRVLLCGVVRQTQFFSSIPSSSQLNSAASQLYSVSESAQFCSKSAQLCSRSCHFCILTVWKAPSVSGSFHLAYSVKSSVILYSALCSRTSSVSCIKSLLYNVDSGLCITLQLWNTVAYSNPAIMHCQTFWKK